MVTEAVRRRPETVPIAAEEEAPRAWPPPAAMYAAIAAVLAWFVLQLARLVGEAPDLDAMISRRESIVFYREGLSGLIADRVGTRVHPPLIDTLTSIAFSLAVAMCPAPAIVMALVTRGGLPRRPARRSW